MSSTRSIHLVSIYDYPEHLNPFYDDDQLKRLRFWRIGSNKKYGGSRRGSFNLGSLKDLLPSSFRKKKTSSTLGINKTSESPPQVRRFIDGYESDVPQFATFDRRFDPATEGAFQRSARYRSSLQNMNNSSLGNRNEPFRSTMQFGNRPTPAKNSRYGGGAFYNNAGSTSTTPRGYYLTPGSSMNSISTNPFDDDDGDSINIENHSSPASGQKRLRKKRQAPLPPKPVSENNHKTYVDDETVELRIKEDVEALKGLEELTRMTEEFQSFVTRSHDDIDRKSEAVDAIQKNCEIDNNAEVYGVNVIINTEKIESKPTVVETSNVRIDEVEVQTSEEPLQSLEINKTTKSPSREETPDYIPLTVREKFHVLRIEETELTDKVKSIKTEVRPKEKEVESKSIDTNAHDSLNQEILETRFTIKESSQRSQSSKNTSDVVSNNASNNQVDNITKEVEVVTPPLEVTVIQSTVIQKEMKESPTPESPKSPRKSSQPNIKEQAVIEEKLTSQGFVRVHEPIKFYEDIETFIRKKDPQSENLEDPPKPPQRRRSVKDVIESINRNQQLLKCATPKFDKRYDNLSQKFSYSHEKPAVPSKQMALFKLQQQAESEKKINALLADLQDFDKQNPSIERTKKFPYDDENNVRSSATFEKCNLRDSSNNNYYSTNVTDDDMSARISCSEINPVPKPRRSP